MNTPTQLQRIVKERDPLTLAVTILTNLETLKPVLIPPAGSIQPEMACRIARTEAVAENKRRLCVSIWLEHVFRRSGETKDLASKMTEFHRAYWRIARVEDEGVCDELGNIKAQAQALQAIRMMTHPPTQTSH